MFPLCAVDVSTGVLRMRFFLFLDTAVIDRDVGGPPAEFFTDNGGNDSSYDTAAGSDIAVFPAEGPASF